MNPNLLLAVAGFLAGTTNAAARSSFSWSLFGKSSGRRRLRRGARGAAPAAGLRPDHHQHRERRHDGAVLLALLRALSLSVHGSGRLGSPGSLGNFEALRTQRPGKKQPPLCLQAIDATEPTCYAYQMSRTEQLQLALPRRGGKRPGAGRPRTRLHPGLVGPGVPHVKRPEFAARCPLHITQRMQPGIGDLRTQSRLQLIKRALHAASGPFGMQVVHFSVQGNHLHLIVEAEGRSALSKSMQSLAVRIAMRLNRLAGRRGGVFADRYHVRVMTTPRDVANTLRYVLENHRKHAREALPWSWKDPFASRIDGPLREPSVWLLRVGWMRAKPPSHLSAIDAFLRDERGRHLC